MIEAERILIIPGCTYVQQSDSKETDAKGLRFALLVARFNSFITERLLAARSMRCTHGLRGSRHRDRRGPGTWEMPVVAGKLAARSGTTPSSAWAP